MSGGSWPRARASAIAQMMGERVHPHPRALYELLTTQLGAVGCDDDEFRLNFLACSELFHAASAGVDYDGFSLGIERAAFAADGIYYSLKS